MLTQFQELEPGEKDNILRAAFSSGGLIDLMTGGISEFALYRVKTDDGEHCEILFHRFDSDVGLQTTVSYWDLNEGNFAGLGYKPDKECPIALKTLKRTYLRRVAENVIAGIREEKELM